MRRKRKVRFVQVKPACTLRTGLAAVWGFEIRLPVTEVDDCNIADVLFISQIYNVLLELQLNSETKVDA